MPGRRKSTGPCRDTRSKIPPGPGLRGRPAVRSGGLDALRHAGHPIQHPRAHAIQNIAVARKTEYPYLAGRLMQAILSRDSRERFLKNGFSWVADKSQP